MRVPELDSIRIELLAGRHQRQAFDCGEPELDRFLREFAGQNDRRDISRTFVAVEDGSARVLGYYSSRTGSLRAEVLPLRDRRRLPRYPVPVIHLARLAVDRAGQGRGLGACLLRHCLAAALRVSQETGVLAVEVLAMSPQARGFYLHYGFCPLQDDLDHLYLPIRAIRKAGSAASC